MIKKIHFVWFGGSALPTAVQSCIKSWKKYCPDFEIVRWDENSFPFSEYRWVKEAIAKKRYDFAADFVRLKVIYDIGGVYVDTDVEIIKPIEDYIKDSFVSGILNHKIRTDDWKYCDDAGIDQRTGRRINWMGIQAGFMYSEPGHFFIRQCLKELYGDGQRAFCNKDGSVNGFVIDGQLLRLLHGYGIMYRDETQMVDGGITIYKSNIFATRKSKDKTTVVIHWFDQSWKAHTSMKMKLKLFVKRYLYKIYRLQ